MSHPRTVEGFESIVRETLPLVYGLAYRLSQSHHDACDIVQETYLRAFRALPKFRGEASISTWLYRICVNTATSYFARRGTRDVLVEPTLIADRVQGASEDKGNIEDREVVRQALALLPDSMRVMVVLKDVCGFSHREAADMLGISEMAAKVRLHRARARLRTILEDFLALERDGAREAAQCSPAAVAGEEPHPRAGRGEAEGG
jgi:RNA polymerase sigma-70 factor (ECF subfamily)